MSEIHTSFNHSELSKVSYSHSLVGFRDETESSSSEATLKKIFGCDSLMHVPRIVKVCLNIGIGSAKSDEKLLNAALNDLSLIAGQKAVVTLAKTSVSTFKIRKGFPVGCKVTLRRKPAISSFIKRLLYVALPDEKDFVGFSSKNFDGRGNLCFGIKEHIIFREIDYDKVYKIIGMNVVIVTTAKTDEQAKQLLTYLDFPFVD